MLYDLRTSVVKSNRRFERHLVYLLFRLYVPTSIGITFVNQRTFVTSVLKDCQQFA